jgi:hypothetical protein
MLVRCCPLLLFICGLGLWGCSSSTDTAEPAAQKPADAPAANPSTPDETVRQFLQAVKDGNDEKAAAMLTNTAREKTAEADMVVAPQGSETASFTVGRVETVEGGAYVQSEWSDQNEAGQRHSDEIVWVVRQDPEGWRIQGMVTVLPGIGQKLVLNFEDPADMVHKQQMAEQALQKHAAEQLRLAQPPAGSGETVKQ